MLYYIQSARALIRIQNCQAKSLRLCTEFCNTLLNIDVCKRYGGAIKSMYCKCKHT